MSSILLHVEWDKGCWRFPDEATDINMLNRQKYGRDLSERSILGVNKPVIHKGPHREELTEETTSWLVLWSTIHSALFLSESCCDDFPSHRAAVHFPFSSLFLSFPSFIRSFIPSFLSSSLPSFSVPYLPSFHPPFSLPSSSHPSQTFDILL